MGLCGVGYVASYIPAVLRVAVASGMAASAAVTGPEAVTGGRRRTLAVFSPGQRPSTAWWAVSSIWPGWKAIAAVLATGPCSLRSYSLP